MKPLPEPKRTLEIDSHGHVQQRLDYRGSDPVPRRPLRVKCDFCSSEVDRLCCRRVRPVCVEPDRGKRMEYCGGHWCACVFCEPLVRDRDLDSLVARVSILNKYVAGVPSWCLVQMWDGVLAALEDDKVRMWESGMAWFGDL